MKRWKEMTELMEMTEKMDQHDRLNGCTDCLILPVLFVEPSRNLSLIRLGTNVLLHHPEISMISAQRCPWNFFKSEFEFFLSFQIFFDLKKKSE